MLSPKSVHYREALLYQSLYNTIQFSHYKGYKCTGVPLIMCMQPVHNIRKRRCIHNIHVCDAVEAHSY